MTYLFLKKQIISW